MNRCQHCLLQHLFQGYLEKHRGVGKTRKRWFALTNKKLTYYTKDAVRLLSHIPALLSPSPPQHTHTHTYFPLNAPPAPCFSSGRGDCQLPAV